MDTFAKICGGKYFVIPANQRGYSWSKQQVDDIFNDLQLAGLQSHYMGPLIVSRDTGEADFQDDDRVTTARFQLEDGQQRFTSFVLVINAIRNEIVRRTTEETPRSLDLKRLLFFSHQGQQLRLQNVNPVLQSCLSHILTGSPLPGSLTPPMSAMLAVASHISTKVADYSDVELLDWANRISNSALFVWVDLATAGINRYLAFDAINSRGLPLSEFDKIKNFCMLVNQTRSLGLVPEDEWYAAITELEVFGVGTRGLEEASIAGLYATFHDESVVQSNVHSSFVTTYRCLLEHSVQPTKNDFVAFVDLWVQWAKSFAFLSAPKRSKYYGALCTASAGEWLDRLDKMELPAICRNLLTACHLRMNDSDFEKVARACEIYTFRVYAVMKYRKDKNSKPLLTLAQEVLRLNKSADYVVQELCRWLAEYAPLSAVINQLANGEPKYYYDTQMRGWPYTYYFLYEYELWCSPSGVAPLPWGQQREEKVHSQEHILPQAHRDAGWWEKNWPDSADAETFKHRLGNLVLTSGNIDLGRKAIGDKLNSATGYSYQHANATNSEKRIHSFTDGTSWGKANILNRERELLQFASERWSVPCCADNGHVVLSEEFREAGIGEIEVSYINCVSVGHDIDDEADNLGALDDVEASL
jgi:hypothetical protein